MQNVVLIMVLQQLPHLVGPRLILTNGMTHFCKAHQLQQILFAGNYTVTVTDFNNCTFTQNYTLNDNPGPVIDSVTSTPVSCFGGFDGTAAVTLVANTGTLPFVFDWNPGTQATQKH
jgi:hypothetical protein